MRIVTRNSILWWPWGWQPSGGLDQNFTPTRTATSVAVSERLWTASATTAWLLPRIPAANFTADKARFMARPARVTCLTTFTTSSGPRSTPPVKGAMGSAKINSPQDDLDPGYSLITVMIFALHFHQTDRTVISRSPGAIRGLCRRGGRASIAIGPSRLWKPSSPSSPQTTSGA